MDQNDRITNNFSRFNQTIADDNLQRATTIKQLKKECSELQHQISELKLTCLARSNKVAELESKLFLLDAENALLRQSEYSHKKVISVPHISNDLLESSTSLRGDPVTCSTSTDLKEREADLYVKHYEGGGIEEAGDDGWIHHSDNSFSRESSSSFDFISDNELVDSAQPAIEHNLEQKLEEERRERHKIEDELANAEEIIEQLYKQINKLAHPHLTEIEELEQSLEKARRSQQKAENELSQALLKIEQLTKYMNDSQIHHPTRHELEHDLETERGLRKDVEDKLRQSQAKVAELSTRINDVPKIALREIRRRKKAEKLIDDQVVKIKEIETSKTKMSEELMARITGLKNTNYALEYQVNEHESAFKNEHADRVALNEEKKRAVRDMQIYEKERDDAIARAHAVELENQQLREERSHAPFSNVQQTREHEVPFTDFPEDRETRRNANEQRKLVQFKEILKRDRDEALLRVTACEAEIQQLKGTTAHQIDTPVPKTDQTEATKEEVFDEQERLEAERDEAIALAVAREKELQQLREACSNPTSTVQQMTNRSSASADASTQSSPPLHNDPHVRAHFPAPRWC